MSTRAWSGRAVTKARESMAPLLPMPCGKCGAPVTLTQRWVIGHRIPRGIRPDLMWDPTNWQPEHRKCSDGSGVGVHLEASKRAKLTALRGGDFLGGPAVAASHPAGLSLPEPEHDPTDWAELVGGVPWLEELATVPPDSTPPRYMTGPHPLAVGSYGPDFARWLEEHPGIHPRRTSGLRWWQLLVAYRLLEHDDQGTLVWRNVLITMARQVGKSWLLRALVLWRITQADRFGEEDQTVIHIAHRLPTASEVWRPAARWATGQSWRVRWANGEQVIESPEGGRWLIRAATDGVGVGFALSVLVADEAWFIERSVVEAADDALTESSSPQLLLISTAGDSASDLFGTYRAQCLEELEDPTNRLLAEWSAPKGSAVGDRAAWRAASPIWSDRREGEVLDKLGKQTELEFRQNYLNQWVPVAHGRPAEPGVAAFTPGEWEAVGGYVPAAPLAAAVESWFGEGTAVALAAHDDEGHVGVSCFLVSSAAEAATYLTGVPSVLVGKSLATDPAFLELPTRAVGSTSRQAVEGLRRLMAEDGLRHDGGAALAGQVLGVRVVAGPDGPRVRSSSRMDAVKAAVWAAQEARVMAEAPAVF